MRARSLRRPAAAFVAAAAVAGAAAAWLLSSGASAGRAQTASPEAPAVPGDPGRYLYLRDCAWCHGERGEGTNNGPSLTGVGAASVDFMLSTGRMPIEQPQRQPAPGDPLYTTEQIDRLVEYLAPLLGGPDIPVVSPERGDLARGLELYEVHCAACHSSTGVGAALTNGLIATDVLGSTATEVAEAVRLGGAGLRSGNMPRFGPDLIDDAELDSLIRYVLYLQRAPDPGGAPLGRIGPVAEGFMAWAAGLLGAAAVAWWIGKTEREEERTARGAR